MRMRLYTFCEIVSDAVGLFIFQALERSGRNRATKSNDVTQSGYKKQRCDAIGLQKATMGRNRAIHLIS